MKSFEIMKLLIPALMLCLGWGIGFLSSILIEKKKNEHAIISKLFEHYIVVHDELTDILSDLASLKVYAPLDHMTLSEAQKRISKIFYKHYDFIPYKVLIEINCLHSCISAGGTKLYFVNSENRISGIDRKNREELNKFVTDVSLTENITGLINVLSHNNNREKSVIINLQSRKVLRIINDHFKFEDILSWGKQLKKMSHKEKVEMNSKMTNIQIQRTQRAGR